MTWVGVSTKMGRTQGQPPVLASGEDAWEPCETPNGGVCVTWCQRAESSPDSWQTSPPLGEDGVVRKQVGKVS